MIEQLQPFGRLIWRPHTLEEERKDALGSERRGRLVSPDCEAPGCDRPAEWRRASTLVLNIEEFLCDAHYHKLQGEWPSLASHFEPLDRSEDDAAPQPR